jgi:hypothetical protein
MNRKNILFILVLFIICFAGCKKYEENPSINLTTKEWRLTHQGYQITSYLINGYDSTQALFTQLNINQTPGYDLCFSIEEGQKIIGCSFYGGVWDFIDHKKYLRIDLEDNPPYIIGPFLTKNPLDWRITKLTENELHLTVDYLGKNYILHLRKLK